MATGSSRRSFFKPTRIIGTLGHLSLASSTHCQEVSRMFAVKVGEAYFVLNVIQRIGSVNGKSDQDNVCF